MTAVGVLCARVRVEEKQVLAALAEAGAQGMPIPPAGLPLPPAPLPPAPAQAGGLAGDADVLVDRVQDRAVAAALATVVRARGGIVLDAGIAASGDRLAVATALAQAGLPRPATWLATGEESALAAVAGTGLPATLVPLARSGAPVTLLDHDAAEAVIEHRAVLGSGIECVSLIQAGHNLESATLLVVDGVAVAVEAKGVSAVSPLAIRIAETAAGALGADIAGIELVETADGTVVWDVHPVPDFRHATPIGDRDAATAIAALAVRRALAARRAREGASTAIARNGLAREEALHVVLTA